MKQKGPLVFAAMAVVAAASVVVAALYLLTWAGAGSLAAVTSQGLLHAVGLSVLTSGAATSLALLLGIPVAYALSRRLVPAGRLTEALLMAPFAMPPVAVGAAALLLLVGPASWLNRVLDVVFTVRGLVAAEFLVIYPMVVRVLRAAFDAVPERLEAVARSLGCSWWCSFTRVVLPLAGRGLAAAGLLGLLRGMGEFGASAVLAGVKEDTATLPIAIYLALSGGDTELAVAMVVVSILVGVLGAYGLGALEARRGEI